ncbi:MAG: alpha-1,4-glucan--maltose-1-phosphate maltosyltransferase [Thaumarchaeota archaeon]|nr:alpha-1,4-glucan--maltose-1-phosphate maltosyltransferase [Nitrososphaerota archaeon]
MDEINRPKSAVEIPPSSVVILNIKPSVDCGRFPAKRAIGEKLVVTADVLKPGHELLTAWVNWRMQNDPPSWVAQPMEYSFDDDSWASSIPTNALGVCEFFIEAWIDKYSTAVRDLPKWASAGEDTSSLIALILDQIRAAERRGTAIDRQEMEPTLQYFGTTAAKSPLSAVEVEELVAMLSLPHFSQLIVKNSDKPDYVKSEFFRVIVDRPKAVHSTWYEMFHRSQGTVPGRNATFRECEERLPEIQYMGFDVLYLPPIHPIGRTNRRGPNNSPNGTDSDPGSPWAIGNATGGHFSVNPELGTIDDFRHFVTKAKEFGLEVAMDLAFQVSPDHPYVLEHPEWFYHRKDGSIRYAENPPKKYYDIYPLNFENDNWKELWEALFNIVDFWIARGIKIFRVDNPHTKPVAFWEWLTSRVRTEHPDVIFLAEAFTRPKPMKLLAKLGFDQSYTYFTWKNTKYELIEFLNEFALSDAPEYYRGNFFANTPDILSEYLQGGGRSAFKIREVLAATLSPSYGIYNGFELCEARAVRKGSEEYLDSEKYQYKVWDWNREGNIKEYITKINTIRRENPALQQIRNLKILSSDSDQIMVYIRWTESLSNIILVAVNLDPFSYHDGFVSIPFRELGLGEKYRVRDLLTNKVFDWFGEKNYVKLDPSVEPAHILRVEK